MKMVLWSTLALSFIVQHVSGTVDFVVRHFSLISEKNFTCNVRVNRQEDSVNDLKKQIALQCGVSEKTFCLCINKTRLMENTLLSAYAAVLNDNRIPIDLVWFGSISAKNLRAPSQDSSRKLDSPAYIFFLPPR